MKSSRDNTCIHTKVRAQTPRCCWPCVTITVEHETSVRTSRSSPPPLDRHAARPLDRSSSSGAARPLDRSSSSDPPVHKTTRKNTKRDGANTWFGDEDEGGREEAAYGDGVAERDEARRRDETNETPGGGTLGLLGLNGISGANPQRKHPPRSK